MFNCNVKIINASLKFLIKVPTQKAKFSQKSLHNILDQIFQTNFKSFSNQRSDTASKLSSLNSCLHFFFPFCLHFFLFPQNIFFCLVFCSSLIRHSGTRRAIKDTQRALGHLRYSESSRALGRHSGTWRALGHSGT